VTAHDAPVVLRGALAGDIAALQHLEVEAGRKFADVGLDDVASDGPPSVDALMAHVTSGTAWVAEVWADIVGYAVASVVDGEAHLDQVSVSPRLRGRGVGRSLIDEVIRWASARSFDSITLTTFADVAWNAPYYERLGFRVVAPHEIGPQLAALRGGEAWLDALAPRVTMRLPLA
jgi:ribosomal protein S18 acetylase RimI-like enzyme